MAGDDVRYLWRQSLHNSSQNPNQRELLDSIRPENYVPPYLRKQESTKKCLVILWIPAPAQSHTGVNFRRNGNGDFTEN